MDTDELEDLRDQAAEIRADLERRELENPSLLLVERRVPDSGLVYKQTNNALATEPEPSSLPLTDDQIDCIAATIADTRNELRAEFKAAVEVALAPLRTELAELRGRVHGMASTDKAADRKLLAELAELRSEMRNAGQRDGTSEVTQAVGDLKAQMDAFMAATVIRR